MGNPAHRVYEHRSLLADFDVNTTAIAFITIYAHNTLLLIPGYGVTGTEFDALPALVADSRNVEAISHRLNNPYPGPLGVKLLVVGKGANLLANSATGAFLVVNDDFQGNLLTILSSYVPAF